MNIFFLGPQGSGKGTQAKRLAKEFGFTYVSTGDIIREAAKENSEIDREVNKEGKLLKDSKTFNLTTGFLEKRKVLDNIIFDGFPRSKPQYELLKNYLAERGVKLDTAVLLAISEKESVRRLSARRMDKDTGAIYNLITNPPPAEVSDINLIQRKDDTEGAIKERLSQYRQVTLPLIEEVKKDDILVEVDGERPIDTIYQELVERLGLKK